jgi:predicted phage terminase large subunit-like protein
MAVTGEPAGLGELVLRKRREMGARAKALPTWTPQPGPQTEFYESTADEVLYGGAAGPGKSSAAVALPLRWAHHPMYRALVLRRETPQLEDLFDKARSIYQRGQPDGARPYRAADAAAEFNSVKGTWTFKSGARVRFNHCQRDDDAFNYQGHEYQTIIFDELTHFTEKQYLEVKSRNRSGIPDLPTYVRSTTNPGGPGHCVPHGEVLTPGGWRDIREMQVGDPVYSVRPDGELYQTRVAQVHKSEFDGELVEVSARGLRIVCTPNHKVAKVGGRRAGLHTRGGAVDTFSLVPFCELPGQATILRTVRWVGHDLAEFHLPAVRAKNQSHLQPTRLSGRDFCELLGWYLSEGTFIYEPEKKWFNIAQEKPENRSKIGSLLERNCFKYHTGPSGFTVHSVPWAAYFSQFGRCRDKFIPDWVKAGSVDDLRVLFDAMMAGDGHWLTPGESGSYYTISAKLADDVAEVALKLGYVVYQSSRQREQRNGLSYEVSFKRTKSGGTEILTGQHCYNVATATTRRSDIVRTKYTGPVYCIGIDETHSFLIRQNGSVWVSGNSWVFKRWGPWLDPDFKLDDWEHVDVLPDGSTVVVRGHGLPQRIEGGKKLPPARGSQVLYVARIGEREVFSTQPFRIGGEEATTRTFIPARLSDNPALLASDPKYRAKLRDNDPVRRRQLEDGDWLVRPAAGLYFKRAWFEIVDEAPSDCVWVRAWDKASTEPHPGNRDPDWTRGVLLGKHADGYYYVGHVAGMRGGPGAVTRFMRQTAEVDTSAVSIRVPQDPGSAGVQASTADVRALDGFAVKAVRVTGSKLDRARPVSSQADPQSTGEKHGRFRVVRGDWNEAFFSELQNFDGDKNNGDHDDQVDALSDAYDELKGVDLEEDNRPIKAGRRRW